MLISSWSGNILRNIFYIIYIHLCNRLYIQGGGMEAVEKLQQLEAIRSSTSRNSRSSLSGMDKDKVLVNQALVCI